MFILHYDKFILLFVKYLRPNPFLCPFDFGDGFNILRAAGNQVTLIRLTPNNRSRKRYLCAPYEKHPQFLRHCPYRSR